MWRIISTYPRKRLTLVVGFYVREAGGRESEGGSAQRIEMMGVDRDLKNGNSLERVL